MYEKVKARLSSLTRDVSPPSTSTSRRTLQKEGHRLTTANVEAGNVQIVDHLDFYSTKLSAFTRPVIDSRQPRICHGAWIGLYERNAGSPRGHHFVIHQHDHPIAGTHYDLRLQCNPTSSISFAIMYGLPGDPNSRRMNRNATETRVHCLWNHLIETASHQTGSMLLWDTGEYEILPYEQTTSGPMSDGEDEQDKGSSPSDLQNEQARLRLAFQNRKIKLRLHGVRLPVGYTISLRLTKENFRSEQPRKPKRRRRNVSRPQREHNDSRSESDHGSHIPILRSLSSLSRLATPPPDPTVNEDHESNAMAMASDDEDESIRMNNAYTGAVNDVGSVHQRRWYLSLDRDRCGFIKRVEYGKYGSKQTTWLPNPLTQSTDEPSGFTPFIVGGRDQERSVLTGRLASDILQDEEVIGYVPRGNWRAVTE